MKYRKLVLLFLFFLYVSILMLDFFLPGFISFYINTTFFHYIFIAIFIFYFSFSTWHEYLIGRIYGLKQFLLKSRSFRQLIPFRKSLMPLVRTIKNLNKLALKSAHFWRVIVSTSFVFLFLFSIVSQLLYMFFANPFFVNDAVSVLLVIFGILFLIINRRDIGQDLPNTHFNKFNSTFLIILIVLIGACLRLYKLGYLYPAGDEYRHLLSMKHYMADGFFEHVASPLPTYIIYILSKFFGVTSLFIFRLPFALLGISTIALFYLMLKKEINIYVALIASYLFAIMPVAIGLSKYIRSYEIEMFTVVLFLYLFSTEIIRNIYVKGMLLIITLKLIGVLFFDVRFNMIVASFTIFVGSYLVLHFINSLKVLVSTRNFLKLLFFPVIFLLGTLLIPILTGYKFMDSPELNYLFFFNYVNLDSLWYSKVLPAAFVVLISLLPIFVKNKKNSNYIHSIIFLFFFLVYFYLFYFDAPRRFQDRYAYLVLPFLIISLSSGIFYLYAFFANRYKSVNFSKYSILFLIIFIVLFNPLPTIKHLSVIDNGDNNSITGLSYFNAAKIVNFVELNNIDHSRILTTQPWIFDYYLDQPFLNSPAEKEKYVFFPRGTNWYDWLDRTAIYGLSGYWSDIDVNNINKLISANKIDYFIIGASMQNDEYIYSPYYPLTVFKELKLVSIIDNDKIFGFYVYKVDRSI